MRGGQNRFTELLLHAPVLMVAFAGVGIFVGGLLFLEYQHRGRVLGTVQTASEEVIADLRIPDEERAQQQLLSDPEIARIATSEGAQLIAMGKDPASGGWLFQVRAEEGATLLWIIVDVHGKIKIL